MKRFAKAARWVFGLGLMAGCGGKLSASHEAEPGVTVPTQGQDEPLPPMPAGGRRPSPSPGEESPAIGEGGTRAVAVGGAVTAGGDGSAGAAGEPLDLPYCAGVATTEAVLIGNLEVRDPWPGGALGPWDPDDPVDTSHLSTSFSVFDALGREHAVDVYFRKSAAVPQRWRYYVLEGHFELSRGTLQFGENGAFVDQLIEQSWSLPLPMLDAPELKLFLDGVNEFEDGGDHFSDITRDGEARRLGSRCTRQPPLDPPPYVRGVALCESRVTERIRIYADFAIADRPLGVGWDPLNPAATSTFIVHARAMSDDSMEVPYVLYFRFESENQWSVHALLDSEVAGVELGGGRFEFDDAGYVRDSSSLQLGLPTRAGTVGRYVALDLSPQFDEFGNRVSGGMRRDDVYYAFQAGREPSSLDCRGRQP